MLTSHHTFSIVTVAVSMHSNGAQNSLEVPSCATLKNNKIKGRAQNLSFDYRYQKDEHGCNYVKWIQIWHGREYMLNINKHLSVDNAWVDIT